MYFTVFVNQRTSFQLTKLTMQCSLSASAELVDLYMVDGRKNLHILSCVGTGLNCILHTINCICKCETPV